MNNGSILSQVPVIQFSGEGAETNHYGGVDCKLMTIETGSIHTIISMDGDIVRSVQ
jgi:hypothetical protein